MKVKKFHKALASGYLLFIVALLYFIGIRLAGTESTDYSKLWITTGIQLLTAFSLLFFYQGFIAFRGRNLLPFGFYLLFVSLDPSFFYDWQGSLYAPGILLCFYFLFRTYQEKRPQKYVLNMGIVLTAGTLFHPVFYLLIPVFLLGLIRMNNLNSKTFLATLCGGIFVYVLLLCWCLFHNDATMFLGFFPDWTVFRPELLQFQLEEIPIFAYLLILLIFSGTYIYFAGISEKLKTRIYLSFLLFFSLFLFGLVVLESQWIQEWLQLLSFTLSLLIAHFFGLPGKKAKTYFLLLSILFFMGMGIWNLIKVDYLN